MPEQSVIYIYIMSGFRKGVQYYICCTVDWFLCGVSNLWNGLMEWNIS